MSDRYIKNAPVKEIMLEISWDLHETQGILSDPNYKIFSDDIDTYFKENKYIHVENISDYGPIPWSVQTRYRRNKNDLPVFQIGHGVMTFNISGVGYQGWETIMDFISLGVKGLLHTYPVAQRQLKINNIKLQYVNVFDEFETGTMSSFMKENLNINVNIPDNILNNIAPAKPEPLISGKLQFPIKDCNSAPDYKTFGKIEYKEGRKTDMVQHRALFLEISSSEIINNKYLSEEEILKKSQNLHNICYNIFKSTLQEKFLNKISER